MESNTSLLFEMHMLNELRKLKPEQRKEMLETLEREEKIEEEALKKNPNLHVETKLTQVLGELKDLRTEMQFIKNSCQNYSVNNANRAANNIRACSLSGMDVCLHTQIQDDDTIDCDECSSLFSSNINWWPIIIFVCVFLTLLSIPRGKSLPCPITI